MKYVVLDVNVLLSELGVHSIPNITHGNRYEVYFEDEQTYYIIKDDGKEARYWKRFWIEVSPPVNLIEEMRKEINEA